MIDKSKLNSAINTLREYCDEFSDCSRCLFYSGDKTCACTLTRMTPLDWDDLPITYTALDYQAAEFCKALGYSMINIGPTHTVCAISGNKGSTFSLPGYLFKDLSHLCRIDIDEILATKPKEAATND
ncbi:MAG: hypothetical protein ACLUIO_00435 [Neglectibacter timonensis]